jgi:TPR repeat protein
VGLGRAYYSGIGGEPDYAAARKHLEKAVADGIPDAAIYLGMIHYGGLGVQRDQQRAEKYFAVAAEAEYFFAYFKLARIAFDKRKYLKGFWLCLKGWFVGFKVSRHDPHDHRLVGLNSASQR